MKNKLFRMFLAGVTGLCVQVLNLIGNELPNQMPITITGKMRLFDSDETWDKLPSKEARFTVHLFTNGWRYAVDSIVYWKGAGGKAFEAAGDGSNIYQVATFDPIAHKKYLEN